MTTPLQPGYRVRFTCTQDADWYCAHQGTAHQHIQLQPFEMCAPRKAGQLGNEGHNAERHDKHQCPILARAKIKKPAHNPPRPPIGGHDI